MLKQVFLTIGMVILGVIFSYWLVITMLVHIGHKTLEEAKKVISEKAHKLYVFLDELAKCKRQVLFHKFWQLFFHNYRHFIFHTF